MKVGQLARLKLEFGNMFKYFIMRIVVIYSLIININFTLAQQIPLGFNSIEEYLRRQQLEGNFDSTVSFTYRPIQHLSSFDSILVDLDIKLKSSFKLLSDEKSIFEVRLLPFMSRMELNTSYPYGGNNGILLRAKGMQQMASGGISLKAGPMIFILRPEIGYSQNKPYEGFSEKYSVPTWQQYYFRKLNRIDLPQQNGKENSLIFHPGQSGLFLNLGFNRIGISTENIWTGPAIHSPIIFSNNAPGFFHFKIDSNKPVNIGIGRLEYLIAVGKLRSSNSIPVNHDSTNRDFFRPYFTRNDRLISIVHFAYSPKFFSGLTIGATRSVQSYEDRVGFDYFDSFTGFFRSDGVFDRADQIASAFGRYAFPKARAEIYFEWGRNDAAWNLRNLLTHPEHSRAYTFGAIKNFSVNDSNWEILMERSVLERSGVFVFNTPEPIFYANTGLRHGHTNQGQIIGSWIGGGSNSLFLELNKFKQLNSIGFFFSHITYDSDSYYELFRNNETDRNWYEITMGLQGNKLIKGLLINWNLLYNRSYNYFWKTQLINNSNTFTSPYIKDNLHINVGVIYLFNQSN